MKTYKIENSGSGQIAAALCQLCQPGQIGEPLVRKGASQSAVALFAASLAVAYIKAGKNEQELAQLFIVASICNASALKQALGKCNLFAEEVCIKDKEGKLQPLLIETYWERSGGSKASPSLAGLDVFAIKPEGKKA